MTYILLSICCSVIVGVLLKLAKRYHINVDQAITFNYLAVIGLCFFFFNPALIFPAQAPLPLYVALGVLLPVIFWVLAIAIKQNGIARTDVAQRLSLFVGILAAWLIFKEQITTLKFAGLLLGLCAIYLILNKAKQTTASGKGYFLVFVFLGFGIIDILFKQVAKTIAVPYTTSIFYIFIISFIVSVGWLMYQFITGKQKFQIINLVCGIILGCFNFGNILFYLKAHRQFADNPSTVFAAMNLGVIVIGSLTGLIVFKERLNKLNFAGIALAIAAVVLITLAQIYAL